MIDNTRAYFYAGLSIVVLIALRIVFAPAPAAAMPVVPIRRTAPVGEPVVEAPTPASGPIVTGELVTIRYSRYDPALGYKRLITYTLEYESGTSLVAAGWKEIGRTSGGSWSRQSRPRVDTHPTGQKKLWEALH